MRWTPTDEQREKMSRAGKMRVGSKNSNWRGGRRIVNGYIWIHTPDHPYGHNGAVMEHRLVMEKALGRILHPKELVHHKNGNKQDNRIENLELMTPQEHSRHHSTGESNPFYGKRHTEETKRSNGIKIGNAHRGKKRSPEWRAKLRQNLAKAWAARRLKHLQKTNPVST